MKRETIIILLLLLQLTACTKAVIENVPGSGEVNIQLDWAGQEVPPGMKFFFYPVDAPVGSLLQMESPATGYQGNLSVGRYLTLAYNTGTSGIAFSGIENYSTASAEAVSVATRADGVTLISQPSLLYAGVTGELEVAPFEKVTKMVVPRLLTKTLKLKFNTEKLTGVTRLDGELYGLFSSVLLSTGEATTVAREQAPRVGTPFTTPIGIEQAHVSISYLGMLNPEKGESYKNEMPLTLTGSDGWQQKVKVDMTQVLTDVASQEEAGGLEFELADEININIEPTPTGVSAYVLSWTRYGEGEGEISYIIY